MVYTHVHSSINVHYYNNFLHALLSTVKQINLPLHFGSLLQDDFSVSDAIQKQDPRSRTSPMGSTMTAPTIPNDLRKPSAVVVVQKGKNKSLLINNRLGCNN